MMDPNRADALIHEIGSAIVHNERYVERAWQEIALVAILDEEVTHVSGFTYDASGLPEPCVPKGFDIHAMLADLADAMRENDQPRWKSALVQIRRDTGAIDFTYEYDDPGRWQVTPANIDTMPRELRPA